MLYLMAVGIELERVRRKSGGRVHLTPHVPASGPVRSLCNQSLAEGTYQTTDEEADCRNCLRRKDDPAVVSSAFFNSELGSELLQRSLEEAQRRRSAGQSARETAVAPPQRPTPTPAKPTSPGGKEGGGPPPAREAVSIRELRSRTPLRKTFENVFTSPQGVIVRVAKDGAISHVTFDGPVDLRRRGAVVTIRAGDIVLELDLSRS